MLRLSFITFGLFCAVTVAKFPNNPKPCAYGDVVCIREILSFLLNQKFDGYKSLNMVGIDPIQIASIDIKQGEESPVNIDLKLRNTELSGLKNATVLEIKGFDKDLTKHNAIYLRVPVLHLIGDYTITGKVLILPIQGTGRTNFTLVNTNVGLYFSGISQDKPDGTHLKVKDMRLSVDPKRVYYHFANLFNGDKTLGDNLNLFLNENWQDIYHEVKVSIEQAFAQVFETIINNVFQKHPYDKLFA